MSTTSASTCPRTAWESEKFVDSFEKALTDVTRPPCKPGEVDRTIQTLDFQAGVGKTVGIIWKLRTPEGKLVFVQVGAVTYTLEGEVLRITPHLLPEDTAPIVCGLLGGHAA